MLVIEGGSKKDNRNGNFNFCDGIMKEKIIAFFADILKEMSKVTWPKKNELRESTVVIIIVCLIIAAFIYLVDTAVSQVLKLIL